jgi:hypothetical protein
MGVTAAQLAQMQADVAALGEQSIQIQRAGAPSNDGTGQWAEVYSNHGSAVLGTLSTPTAGMIQVYATKLGSLASWLVSLPVGTDVLENDQLVTSTQTLHVQVALVPESFQVCIRLLATEVK